MDDPVGDAKRIIEQELADNGFAGYAVSARQTASQVIVSVASKGQARTAEGTEDMMIKAIAQAKEDGVPLETEFENWNMYS